MTDKFQAGIGPNMHTLHIRKVTNDLRADVRAKPSLCEATNIVRDYRGAVSISGAKLCKRCFRILQQSLPEGSSISAELIGVSSIEE